MRRAYIEYKVVNRATGEVYAEYRTREDNPNFDCYMRRGYDYERYACVCSAIKPAKLSKADERFLERLFNEIDKKQLKVKKICFRTRKRNR